MPIRISTHQLSAAKISAIEIEAANAKAEKRDKSGSQTQSRGLERETRAGTPASTQARLVVPVRDKNSKTRRAVDLGSIFCVLRACVEYQRK